MAASQGMRPEQVKGELEKSGIAFRTWPCRCVNRKSSMASWTKPSSPTSALKSGTLGPLLIRREPEQSRRCADASGHFGRGGRRGCGHFDLGQAEASGPRCGSRRFLRTSEQPESWTGCRNPAKNSPRRLNRALGRADESTGTVVTTRCPECAEVRPIGQPCPWCQESTETS